MHIMHACSTALDAAATTRHARCRSPCLFSACLKASSCSSRCLQRPTLHHSTRLVSSRLVLTCWDLTHYTTRAVHIRQSTTKSHSTCREHGLTRYKYRIILAVLHSSKFRLMHYCNSSMRHQAITQSFPAISSQTHRSILSLLAAKLLLL